MLRRHTSSCLSVLALIGALACSKNSDEGATGQASSSGETKGTKRGGEKATKPLPKPPGHREGYTLFRSLLLEANRSELRDGGLFIDFGTRDEDKYIRGGWDTGFIPSDDEDVTAARVEEQSAQLNTYLLSAPAELVVRAKSIKGSTSVALRSGKTDLGSIDLASGYQEYRVSLPSLGTGRKKFQFELSAGSQIDIDWLFLADKKGQEAPTIVDKVRPVKMNKGLRRSLLAPGPRSYSFYLHVPEEATLIFDHAAKTPLDFVVRYEGLDGASQELFRESAEASWTTSKVDLSSLAGQAIRLELATEGEGEGGAWGEAGIFVAPKPDKSDIIASAPKAKNLVFIVMDTTRADQFELFTPANGIHTPKLDAFSEKATSFTRAYNNGNWTKPSVLTMLSSLYPATHTATKPESRVPDDIGLLSEHLKKHGVTTQGFTSNPVVSDKFGFERGWDGFGVFYEAEAHGKAMYERASEWTKEHGDSPFFLYIQTIDPHTTYSVEKKYWNRYFEGNYSGPIGESFTREDQSKVNDRKLKVGKRDIDWIQALYHGEITYQDEHVGGFLDALEEQGRLDDTIIVVTNDHGEEIYDHGSFGHGWQLYEEMIRAPLMIHYPALFPKATQVETITEHVDLAPTLLEAMGLPPMQHVEGRSFLPALHGAVEYEPAYALALSDNGKRSVHVGDWKLEVHKTKGWKLLSHITSDTGESKDRRRDAELAGRLCEIYMGEGMATPSKLKRQMGVGGRRRIQAQDAEMDEETRKQMEALGYL